MDTRLNCPICNKTFTQKSSLVRHSKRCTLGPAPSLRQKSCRQCTSSKTKCDLRRPRCSRCKARDTMCQYIIPLTRGVQQHRSSDDTSGGSSDEHVDECANLCSSMAEITAVTSMSFPEVPQPCISPDPNLTLNEPFTAFGFAHCPGSSNVTPSSLIGDKDPLSNLRFPWNLALTTDTTSSQLSAHVNQINAIEYSNNDVNHGDFLSDDWLLWNPVPLHATPPLVKHSMETLLRVMKTWPKMLAKEFQAPPLLHFTHTQKESLLWPMANCMKITKKWSAQSDGAGEVIRQTLIQELRTIFSQHRDLDEPHLLAALQALAMYIIILMFPSRAQFSVSIVDPAIFLCLRKVVWYVASTGLLLTEERDGKRPSWESWVHVTAKRRAVLSLYLLHWSYSVYHNLEPFACSQLGFMPAPAPKFLWQADSRAKWEDLYARWLEQWGEFPYMMRELETIMPGTALEPRSEMWLEDADELGVLIFSIVNATDRGQPAYDYGNGIPVLTTDA